MSRSPSSHLVDEFEYLWRTENLSVAAQLVQENFRRLPDPGPLRIAIALGLFQYDRYDDARTILIKTIEHYICSGFFFRALAAYVLLRNLSNEPNDLPELMWSTFGPRSDYIRRSRRVARFPEPDPEELLLGEELRGVTPERSPNEVFDLITEIALDPYALKLSPGFVPKIPIFSELTESVFTQLVQLIDIRQFESTQVVEEFEEGELVWTVGDDAFIRTEREVFQLSSGTILGLQHYIPITSEVPPFELIANYATFLRLPLVALQALKTTWFAADDDLRLLAYSSLIEQRLVNHSLITSIPQKERQAFISGLVIRVIERGNILGVSDTENHLGGNSAASPFFLVLAGDVAIEALDPSSDGQPASLILSAPSVIGAFNYFLEDSPTMVFRSLTHVVIVELTAAEIQELVLHYPKIGTQLTHQAEEILANLQV